MDRLRGKLIVGTVALFAVLMVLFAVGCGEETKTLDPTKIGDYNKPGTVLVETVWTADVTAPDLTFDQQAMTNYLVAEMQSGRISRSATDQQLQTALIAELIANPQKYLKAAPTDKLTTMESSSRGSGFIVTEDGNVVTNAHIVKKSEDELREQMAVEVVAEQLLTNLASFESGLGIDLPPEFEDRFFVAAADIIVQYMTVSKTKSDTNMYMVSVSGGLSDPIAAEVVEVGDPIDMKEETGKDVAILKVNKANLPTVAVGDDTSLRDGELAIALGYPGIATFSEDFDPNKISPTLTQGTISSQKTMEGGWKVIQTDATISDGSSGSPLLNNKGEAIAVNTFTAAEVDEQTGEVKVVENFNYAVPASVVKEYLSKANVTATLGTITRKYREAIDLYDKEHYSAARDKFKEVQDASADFPYVKEYIEKCSSNITAGRDKSTFPIPKWLLYLLIPLLLIVVFLVLLFVVILPKGKKKKGAAAGAPPVQPKATAPTPPPAAAPPTPPPAPEPPKEAPAKEEPVEEPTKERPAAAPEEGKEEAGGAGPGFCSKCGNELKPDDEFCSSCGNKVEK